MEKKGRSESKSDVTCVEAVEAAAEAEDGGVNGGGDADGDSDAPSTEE